MAHLISLEPCQVMDGTPDFSTNFCRDGWHTLFLS